jgi:hypothetical protein
MRGKTYYQIFQILTDIKNKLIYFLYNYNFDLTIMILNEWKDFSSKDKIGGMSNHSHRGTSHTFPSFNVTN